MGSKWFSPPARRGVAVSCWSAEIRFQGRDCSQVVTLVKLAKFAWQTHSKKIQFT